MTQAVYMPFSVWLLLTIFYWPCTPKTKPSFKKEKCSLNPHTLECIRKFGMKTWLSEQHRLQLNSHASIKPGYIFCISAQKKKFTPYKRQKKKDFLST